MNRSFGDPIWEQIFSSRDWGKYPPEEVIRFYNLAKTELSDVPSVLDIGCGKGACSWYMSKEGGYVTAIDGSPSGISDVDILANEFNLETSIDLVLGDITKPKSHLSSSFNIMVDNYSLCVNPEEKIISALEDYYELLKVEGHFLMNSFGEKSTGYGTGTQLSEHTWTDVKEGCMKDRGVITWFESEYLHSLVQNFGFVIQSYTNILENRDNMLIEKHILHLCKG